MVECQWDSVVLSPYSPVLAGLELTFMCLTRSNSSLFSTPGFVVAPSDLSMSSIFGLWSSYMLEYCWLFALLLRSARYFPGAEGKWIPLPPMLPPSSSNSLIFIVIQLQLYAFSPHPSTRPQLNPHPSPTSTLPLDFVHVSFIVVLVIPSPHGPLLTVPSPLPPDYC